MNGVLEPLGVYWERGFYVVLAISSFPKRKGQTTTPRADAVYPEIELGFSWEEVCLRTSERYSRKPVGKPSKTTVIWKQEYSSCQILQTTFLTKLLDMSSCDTVLHGI